MIKILFYNRDGAGVNYYRTLTPAMELERNHSDKFHVEINPEIDFNNPKISDYLKTFDIIHYHRQLHPNTSMMIKLAKELKDSGVKLVVDIDDYWNLDKTHPFYSLSKEKKLHLEIIDNLKIADYITTTTDVFADEIKKLTGKDNVSVLYNSINPEWMKQFKDNRKPDVNGLVRICYVAGSSHMHDMQQLRTVINYLNSDSETRGKFKIIVAGFDTQGTTTDIEFNEEFAEELKKLKLWNKKIITLINQTRGDVDQLPLSDEIKNKYRNNVFKSEKRSIKSDESVYYEYEKILTDNYNILNDDNYKRWLMNFERGDYDNEKYYSRRWTQKANKYAEVLNETDIALAPLADTTFNRQKSNLKQVECWSRKIPVICSDIPPYDVDGKHMENCVLIPVQKNAHKYWKKALKKLILDKELRDKIGENLYNDFKEKYHLTNVTNKRADYYIKMLK